MGQIHAKTMPKSALWRRWKFSGRYFPCLRNFYRLHSLGFSAPPERSQHDSADLCGLGDLPPQRAAATCPCGHCSPGSTWALLASMGTQSVACEKIIFRFRPPLVFCHDKTKGRQRVLSPLVADHILLAGLSNGLPLSSSGVIVRKGSSWVLSMGSNRDRPP